MRHGKKRQNYDFQLTNKSANNYITQKVLNFSKKGARKKKKTKVLQGKNYKSNTANGWKIFSANKPLKKLEAKRL